MGPDGIEPSPASVSSGIEEIYLSTSNNPGFKPGRSGATPDKPVQEFPMDQLIASGYGYAPTGD